MKIAICGAAPELSWNEDIQSKLLASGKFNSVDIIDVIGSTPTLSTLLEYDAILVFSDDPYDNSVTLGNVIADYIDTGRGVVSSVFETSGGGSPNSTLHGRWKDEGYYPIEELYQGDGIELFLGTIFYPNHPIFEGVNTFSGGEASYFGLGDVSLYTTILASWDNGYPLVVEKTKTDTGNNIAGINVALNFYPPSEDVRADFWRVATDGALLLANTLAYAAKNTASINTTCSQQVCPEPAFKCLKADNVCTCAKWKYFYPNCTRLQQNLGICNGKSGAYVPAIVICNQRIF